MLQQHSQILISNYLSIMELIIKSNTYLDSNKQSMDNQSNTEKAQLPLKKTYPGQDGQTFYIELLKHQQYYTCTHEDQGQSSFIISSKLKQWERDLKNCQNRLEAHTQDFFMEKNDLSGIAKATQKTTKDGYIVYKFKKGNRIAKKDFQFLILDQSQKLNAKRKFYSLVRSITKGIIKLQQMQIYHQDLVIRNIIEFENHRYQIIDFGQILVFNESDRCRQMLRLSKQCAYIRQKVNKQQNYQKLKKVYPNKHRDQFHEIINLICQNHRSEQIKQIRLLIEDRNYRSLIDLCDKLLQQIEKEMINNKQSDKFIENSKGQCQKHHQQCPKQHKFMKEKEETGINLISKQQGKPQQSKSKIDIQEIREIIINKNMDQWAQSRQYNSLIYKLKNNSLSKVQQYYKQKMGSTIQKLASLKQYSRVFEQYKKDQCLEASLQLEGLQNFTKCKDRQSFDQIIECICHLVDKSLSKINQMIIEQIDKLKDTIDNIFKFNDCSNIVLNSLNQKYKTVVNAQDNGKFGDLLNHSQSNQLCFIPINEIKKNNLSRIQILKLDQSIQKQFDQQVYQKYKYKCQQEAQYARKNSLQIGQNNKQAYNGCRKQLTICKTLDFIKSHNFGNLKSLELNITQNFCPHPKYQFSAFDLFKIVSKNRLHNLIVKGVKILQFQEFIKVFYDIKHNDNKSIQIYGEKYQWIKNIQKSQTFNLQIDAEVRFAYNNDNISIKKKTYFLYFLQYLKQLKSITITLQSYKSQLALQLIEKIQTVQKITNEIQPINKIANYNINLLKCEINSQSDYQSYKKFLKKLMDNSDWIKQLKLIQNCFSKLKNIGSKESKHSNHQKNKINLFIVNCTNVPIIFSQLKDIANLCIHNSTFFTQQIKNKQMPAGQETQSLSIVRSHQFYDRFQHTFQFNNLRYLNISINQYFDEYFANKSLPLLKVLIISRQKQEKFNVQPTNLSRFLENIQKLQVLEIKNIPVSSRTMKSIRSDCMKILKLSSLSIQNQNDLEEIINLFKDKFCQISQLSLKNIVSKLQQSKLDALSKILYEMPSLRKLVISKKLLTKSFNLKQLEKRGVLVTICQNQFPNS